MCHTLKQITSKCVEGDVTAGRVRYVSPSCVHRDPFHTIRLADTISLSLLIFVQPHLCRDRDVEGVAQRPCRYSGG